MQISENVFLNPRHSALPHRFFGRVFGVVFGDPGVPKLVQVIGGNFTPD